MRRQNRFTIRNDFDTTLTLNIEPEGVFYPLGQGEEVSVTDDFAEVPISVKLSRADDAGVIVSIWPGDGDVKVEKDGVDVFDLVQGSIDRR